MEKVEKVQVTFTVDRNNKQVEAFRIVVKGDGYLLKTSSDIVLTLEELETGFGATFDTIKSLKRLDEKG